jgi:TonB family protein
MYFLSSETQAGASRVLVFSFFLSLILHGSLVLTTYFWDRSGKIKPVNVAVSEFPSIELLFLNEVETLQKESRAVPKDAKFTSTKNLQTQEETSPELQNHSLVQAPSRAAKPRIESFSLTDEDRAGLQQMVMKSEAMESQLAPSRGFLEKLKRGEELKVNAFRHDASGFVSRMKRKIQVTWNPRSSVSSEMARFNRITVTLGIVLSRKGELLDLWIIQPSFFEAYDKEALRTIRESVPFPNPPEYLVQEDGKIYMPWSFLLYTSQFGVASVE